MKHFVYITTNLINGKQYVGDHSTSNLEDGYIGSGKTALLPAIKKYGKQNFQRKILEFFDTKEDAFNAQEKYIKDFNTLVPNGYNISPTGGRGVKGWHKHSEETKEKQRLNRRGGVIHHNEETRKKLSKIHKNKKKKYTIWNKGLKMSEEFCEKTKRGIEEKRKFNPNYINRFKM